MKKLIAFVLAFTMVAAMAVPALAEEGSTTTDNNKTSVTEADQSANITVHGTYQGPQDVISVDVVWDAMDFIYTNKSDGTWNPTTHKYEYPTTAGWSWKGASEDKTAPEIKLSNHSNVGVKAAFGFNSAIEGLTSSFTNLTDENAFTLARAEADGKPENAPSNATAFSLSGTGITEESQELGKITVTISKDDATTPDTPTVTEVKDAAALTTAILGGDESIRLMNDITITMDTEDGATALAVQGYTGTIDLNQHTLELSDKVQLQAIGNSKLTIENGTIKGSYGDFVYIGDKEDADTSVTMNNCTIENGSTNSTASAIAVDNGTVVLNNCILNSLGDRALQIEGGNVTLSGETKLTADMTHTESPIYVAEGATKPTCLAGTYNFNPMAYVDPNSYTVDRTYVPDPSTGETAYTVWIVTAKADTQG